MSTHGFKKNLRGAQTYTPPHSKEWHDNYDRIFGKKDEKFPVEEPPTEPPPVTGEDFPVWRGVEPRTVGALLVALRGLQSRDEAQLLMTALRRCGPHAESNVACVAVCLDPKEAQRLLEWCGAKLPDDAPEDLTTDMPLTPGKLIVRAGASGRP